MYTKTQVQRLCLNLIDYAPTSLDTRNELATALADGATFASTSQNISTTRLTHQPPTR